MSSSIFNFNRYLLIAIGGGLALLLVVLCVLEGFLRFYAEKNDDGNVYKKRFLSGTASWAAFGDSHVEGALVSSEWLDNLGQASDNLDTIIAKVSLRVDRGGVTGIILPADPQMFSFYRLSANQSDRIEVLDTPHSEGLLLLDHRYRHYLSRTFWSLLRNPSRLFQKKEQQVVVQTQPPQRPQNWLKSVTIRVQLHSPVQEIATSAAAKRYQNLVRELKDAKVKVCFVRYPVSADYLRISSGFSGFEEAVTFFQLLASNENIALVDLSDALPDDIFVDPDHIPKSEKRRVTRLVQEGCGISVNN